MAPDTTSPSWAALPPDAWCVVASFSSLADLCRLRRSTGTGTTPSALAHALENLCELDLTRASPPSNASLRLMFDRCPRIAALVGLYCSNLTAPFPPLPPGCRKLALRLSDSWGASESAAFLRSAAAWVAAPLESLTIAWNPQDTGKKTDQARKLEMAAQAAEAISETWQCPAVQALYLHRAPWLLGRAVLRKALEHGALLQAAHLIDVAFPDARALYWQNLVELSYTYEQGPFAIDDAMMHLLGRASPPLRRLRLADRSLGHQTPSVSIAGMVAVKPLLWNLEELRLARIFGPFCDASDIDLLMCLEGALGPALVHLDLEGFPRLSDAALLEILSGTRASPSKSGLQVLRLLSTSVSDTAFVNGLDEALAPSLRELRLSSNNQMTDCPLQCLAEAGRCCGLERLTLGGASFGDMGFMAVVSATSKLRALFLRDLALSDEAFAALAAGAPNLQELGLSGILTAKSASLEALQGLPLASLRLAGCPGLGNAALSQLLGSVGRSLSSLSLEHCPGLNNLCLQGLSKGTRLPRLQHLRVIGIKVSGVILTWFNAPALPELRRLELWRSRWPGNFSEAEASFRAARPEVVLSLRRSAETLGWANW